MRGIDVSKFQGAINWPAVKAAGIEFVIIRAGYGRETWQKDAYFERNYTGAKAAGLHVGAYWYSYADTIDDAKKEVAACLKVIKGKEFDFPIYFDLEENKQLAKGAAFCSGLVRAFCSELEKAGYFAGLYMSRYHLQQSIEPETAKRYALWVAEYGNGLHYTGKYGIWQYSDAGRVVGIIGNVDMDNAVVDYSKIIINGGFNGYPKQVTQAKPVEQAKPVTYKVEKGDTLTAIARKYKTTVKALQNENGIKNANLIYAGQVLKIPVKTG